MRLASARASGSRSLAGVAVASDRHGDARAGNDPGGHEPRLHLGPGEARLGRAPRRRGDRRDGDEPRAELGAGGDDREVEAGEGAGEARRDDVPLAHAGAVQAPDELAGPEGRGGEALGLEAPEGRHERSQLRADEAGLPVEGALGPGNAGAPLRLGEEGRGARHPRLGSGGAGLDRGVGRRAPGDPRLEEAPARHRDQGRGEERSSRDARPPDEGRGVGPHAIHGRRRTRRRRTTTATRSVTANVGTTPCETASLAIRPGTMYPMTRASTGCAGRARRSRSARTFRRKPARTATASLRRP